MAKNNIEDQLLSLTANVMESQKMINEMISTYGKAIDDLVERVGKLEAKLPDTTPGDPTLAIKAIWDVKNVPNDVKMDLVNKIINYANDEGDGNN